MNTEFLLELDEKHPDCGSHYELWSEKGQRFVYCPKCELSWDPNESAERQFREWLASEKLLKEER